MKTPFKLVTCAALALHAVVAPAQDEIKPGPTNDHFKQIIVKIKPPISIGANDLSGGWGATDKAFLDHTLAERQLLEADLETLTGLDLQHVREMSGKADVFQLADAANAAEVAYALEQISAHPDILYAEHDALMHAALTPNDPRYLDQWHYYENLAGIRLPQAWNITTGSNLVVAVADTGIRPHVDINNKIVPGYDMISDPFMGNDGNGRDSNPHDDWPASQYHGTHVAGTVAAQSNNGTGVAGVSWGARILPVRVLGRNGGTLSDIADGIRWSAGLTVPGVPANGNAARVINLSLGGFGACGQTFESAINAATAMGALVIAAAGNSNQDVANFRPANCTNAMAIASINRSADRSSFSNKGAGIDVAAPGGGDFSLQDDVLSLSGNSNAYTYLRGTSMAAPHVSGVAALAFSLNGQLSPQQVRNLINQNTRSFPAASDCTMSLCGTGIVDAEATLLAVSGPGTATVQMIASYVPVGSSNRTTYTLNNQNSPLLEFEYFENQGHFEQRPGGVCNTGQNNPNYFKIRFNVSEPIDACNFQASWDSNPINCNSNHINTVNSGAWVILNTDTFATNPATCALFSPPRVVLPPFSDGWFHVNIVIDGETYSRRINFSKEFELPGLP